MLTRREFLKRGTALVSIGMFGPTAFERAFRESALAAPAGTPTVDRKLIIVQLAGANDGLNTVIPYADGRYRDGRHDIAVPEGTELRLNERLGLHPNLDWFKERWDGGQLAIIEAVGYPKPSRSHFESMAIWQTADRDAFAEGWIGRTLRPEVDGTSIRALGVAPQTPPEFVASGFAAPSFSNIQQYRISPGAGNYDPAPALLQLYDQYPSGAPFAALLDGTMQEVYRSTTALQQVHAAYTPMAEYPATPFAGGLRVLAEAVNAELGLRVGQLSLGGFDTHDSEVNGLPPLLKTLNDGLRAFFADLEAHGRADSVTVMIWSEFGRRVRQNGSGGTDHGKGNAMLLVGPQVQGGATYGDPADLGNLDDGDIAFHTDFRSVYATLLNDWLQVEPKSVLGASYPLLGFMRT